jgi:ferredoxin-NADP reductase
LITFTGRWLHSARDRQHHPFAAEVRRLMPALTHAYSYVCYSRPGAVDKIGEDFDATGHLSRSVFDHVGFPRDADVYLCGPTRFMADMKEELATLGVSAERIHIELFNGSESMTPGVFGATKRTPIYPRMTPTPAHWYRSRVVALPHTGRHRPTRAFWGWLRRATFQSVGRAGPVFVTAVRAG